MSSAIHFRVRSQEPPIRNRTYVIGVCGGSVGHRAGWPISTMLTKTVDRCGLSSEASYELRLERSKMPETARATRFATDADDGADEVVPPTFLSNARLSWEPAGRSPMVDLGCDLGPGLHGEEGYVSCYSPVRPSRNEE